MNTAAQQTLRPTPSWALSPPPPPSRPSPDASGIQVVRMTFDWESNYWGVVYEDGTYARLQSREATTQPSSSITGSSTAHARTAPSITFIAIVTEQELCQRQSVFSEDDIAYGTPLRWAVSNYNAGPKAADPRLEMLNARLAGTK